MPELPEVETVRNQLLDKVLNKEIVSVEVFHSKTVGHDMEIIDRLVGKKISEIERVGKLMIFSFKKEEDLYMLAHLKMTGQFFFVDRNGVMGGGHKVAATDVAEFPGRHTRLALNFKDGSTLYFNDMRLFGYVKLTDKTGAEVAKSNFGPEPISDNFDHAWFAEALMSKKRSIKAVLLDQSFIAGLGNIYVDEALFQAKVRPDRLSNTITKKEAMAISKAAGEVMKKAIKYGGTTFQHFADTDGSKGNFTQELQVFGKQGIECPRCKGLIIKEKIAGRGTHFCPNCQV